MSRIKIYTAQRMTGRYQDEMRQEAEMLVRVLDAYGYEALNPVIEEKVPNVHEILPSSTSEQLERYWKRDKEMIRDADLLLDYQSNNLSDGASKELGYARYCLWKPTIRIVTRPGFLISKLEDDVVVESLTDAINIITARFGSYEKLAAWRQNMWDHSFQKWFAYQLEMNARYGSRPQHVSLEVIR